MSRKSFILVFSLVAGLSIIGIFLFVPVWHKEQKLHYLESSASKIPIMEINGVEFTQLDENEKKVWILSAARAIQFSDSTILENAEVKLFKEGNLTSQGTADRIIIENSTSNFTLKGNICIVSYRDGTELRTSELFWNNSERKLYTEKEVDIKKKGLVIQGKGLICKPDLSLIIIKSEVKTYFEGGVR